MTAREAYAPWVRQVGDYSRCTLTIPSDKVPALSALASRYGTIFSSQLARYVDGIWDNFLIDGLRWAWFPARRSMQRPERYRAPSWSWASLDGAWLREPVKREDQLLSKSVR